MTSDRTSSTLQFKPEGKWSVHEHVGHLLTIESLWIARLDDFVLKRETLRPWNGTNFDTDAANFNQQRLAKIIEDLDEIRTIHLKMLVKYADRMDKMQAKHPRMDSIITLADHVHFMAEHDKHHINKIQGIFDLLS